MKVIRTLFHPFPHEKPMKGRGVWHMWHTSSCNPYSPSPFRPQLRPRAPIKVNPSTRTARNINLSVIGSHRWRFVGFRWFFPAIFLPINRSFWDHLQVEVEVQRKLQQNLNPAIRSSGENMNMCPFRQRKRPRKNIHWAQQLYDLYSFCTEQTPKENQDATPKVMRQTLICMKDRFDILMAPMIWPWRLRI